jgi:hypothetical protein
LELPARVRVRRLDDCGSLVGYQDRMLHLIFEIRFAVGLCGSGEFDGLQGCFAGFANASGAGFGWAQVKFF